jgi:hypothetical protein
METASRQVEYIIVVFIFVSMCGHLLLIFLFRCY